MSYTFGCRKQGCAWRLFCRCHKIALNNMYEHCNQIKPSMVQTWIGSTSNGQTLAYPCPRRTTLSFARALWVYDLLITIKITTVCHWPIPLPLSHHPFPPLRYLTFTRPFSFTTKGRHAKSAGRHPFLIMFKYASMMLILFNTWTFSNAVSYMSSTTNTIFALSPFRNSLPWNSAIKLCVMDIGGEFRDH